MTTVFIHEDVTATWAGGDAKSPPALSLLAEGRAMLQAVTADFRAASHVLFICEPAAVAAGECDQSDRGSASPPRCGGPSATDDDGSRGFREYVKRSDYALLIAPECGGRLDQLATEVLRLGGKLLGPGPTGIRLTSDKLALARHWHHYGVPTPRTWLLGSGTPRGPHVVKPRDGAGSQATALIAGCSRHRLDWPGQFIGQDHVPGFAVSVAFLIGPRSITPLVPCEQRLSNDGRFQYLGGRMPVREDLAERAVRVAAPAVKCVRGLLGYVGVDVVLGDDGRDWAIEINPRITTSYVGLRALARFNLAEAMLAAVEGREELPPLEWRSRQIEFTPDGQVDGVL